MDDGFQNPSLAKDASVLVVDAGRGIGNGRVIPAGPLRAPLAAQLARAHALVMIGKASRRSQRAAAVLAEAGTRNIPVVRARLQPDAGVIAALGSAPVLAFAGIGDPEKFFATLADAGIAVAATRSFADHHRYTQAEAQALCDDADRQGLALITTEKDSRASPVTTRRPNSPRTPVHCPSRWSSTRRMRSSRCCWSGSLQEDDRGQRTEDGGQRTEDDSRER